MRLVSMYFNILLLKNNLFLTLLVSLYMLCQGKPILKILKVDVFNYKSTVTSQIIIFS